MTVLFETEGLLLYGAMAPEILAWAVMFDVGVLIDALLISAAVLASNGVRVLRAQAEALSQRMVTSVVRRSGRARRLRRPSRPAGKTSCDDGPGWAPQPAYLAFSMA